MTLLEQQLEEWLTAKKVEYTYSPPNLFRLPDRASWPMHLQGLLFLEPTRIRFSAMYGSLTNDSYFYHANPRQLESLEETLKALRFLG